MKILPLKKKKCHQKSLLNDHKKKKWFLRENNYEMIDIKMSGMSACLQ